MKFVIEKATENECEIILRLLTDLYLELGEEKESISYLSFDFIKQVLFSNVTEIYLAKVDTKCVGIFTLTETQAIYAGGKYGVLDEMYITPSYRREKTGQSISKFISVAAQNKKWNRIDVTAPTETKWIRTQQFYHKNGFVFTGQKFKLNLQKEPKISNPNR